MFAILSPLDPTPKCDLMTKLKLYNGEEVIEKGRTKKIDVRELRDDAKREGMSGISTRYLKAARQRPVRQRRAATASTRSTCARR